MGHARLIKSSADFLHTTFIKIWMPTEAGGKPHIETTKIPIMSSIVEDPDIYSIVDSYEQVWGGMAMSACPTPPTCQRAGWVDQAQKRFVEEQRRGVEGWARGRYNHGKKINGTLGPWGLGKGGMYLDESVTRFMRRGGGGGGYATTTARHEGARNAHEHHAARWSASARCTWQRGMWRTTRTTRGGVEQWGSRTRKRGEACGGRPGRGRGWAAKTVKRPPQRPAQPPVRQLLGHTYAKRHHKEHRPQRPSESIDPAQHAKGRTADCPGSREETATRRKVTQGAYPPNP